MTDKLFNIAGTSTYRNENTWRFATHPEGKLNVRVNKLKVGGHTNIALQTLPRYMTKADAIAFLSTQGISAVMPGKKQGTAAVAAPVAEVPVAAATTPVLTAKEKQEARNAAKHEKRAKARAANEALIVGKAAPVAELVQEVIAPAVGQTAINTSKIEEMLAAAE